MGQDWRWNCKPGFHPAWTPLLNSSQTRTPSWSGQSFAQKGLLPQATPHHHLTTPHLLRGVMAQRARGWPARQGQHRRWAHSQEARARDGPQYGSGLQTLPGWGVQHPEQPDRSGLLRDWGPQPDGTVRLVSSSLRCFSYTVAPEGLWRLVRELSPPSWQMRVVLGTARLHPSWEGNFHEPPVCMSGPGPSSGRWAGCCLAPLERPLRMRGAGLVGWQRLLSLAGDGAWGPVVRTPDRYLKEEERAGCWFPSGSAEIRMRKQIQPYTAYTSISR